MLHCKKRCIAKNALHRSGKITRLCIAAMRRCRAVCFLGRFLPKLGGAKSAASFFAFSRDAWPAIKPRGGRRVRKLFLDGNHVRKRRTASASPQELLHGGGFACHQCLYGSVRPVSDPAGNSEFLRLADHPVPKPDTLNPSRDAQPFCTHFLFSIGDRRGS